ncbi:MAG: hypothetical protein QY319_05010 [Candidatus Kapaibacterium sp.]|nr:MAG: hypothetical protein QY319_05010 [Candidatus Kapabacteria bacterium]
MNDKEMAVHTMLREAGFVDISTPKQFGDRWCVTASVNDPEGASLIVGVSIGDDSAADWAKFGDLFQLPNGAQAEWPDTLEQMRDRMAAYFNNREEIIKRIQVKWDRGGGPSEDLTESVQEWLRAQQQ